ncbi:MAG: preprotein translocase subunit SecG [Oscillospiraceae bacterium]|nr:preprotein translocase subunit SecG [Oscillospiraceae bacterium]
MSVWEIIGGCLMLVVGIFIIVVVMLQESKQPGLSSSISGGMEYDTRGRGKTSEAILVKLTKISAIAFFVITLAVNFVSVFFK